MTDTSPLRLALTTILSIAALTVWLWVGASAASAGTFTVFSCHDPAGNAVGTSGWTVTHSSGFFITTNVVCATASDQMSIQTGPSDGGYTESQGALSQLPAADRDHDFKLQPGRHQLLRAGVRWQLQRLHGDVGDVWVTNSTLQDPTYNFRDLGAGSQTPGTISSSPGDATYVDVAADCDDSNTARVCQPNTLTASVDVDSGVFTLFDPSSPRVTSVTGPLVSGGTLSGTEAVDFIATDSGSGIYSAIVDVDGQQVSESVLDSNNGLCADLGQTTDGTRSFASPQPCATTVNAAASLDTTQLTAGTHHLQVFVDDAAGDRALVYDGTITVNNPPTDTTAPSLTDTTHPTGAAQVGATCCRSTRAPGPRRGPPPATAGSRAPATGPIAARFRGADRRRLHGRPD